MSVRRLADEEFQPKSFAFTKANESWAKQTIGKYPEGRQASAVIPLLMRVQEQEGWVTRPAVEYVAGMLEMPLIRVLEVATFYTQFMLKPVGKQAHVQVCGTTPCMLRGAEKLVDVCKHRINHEPLERNEAGTLSWEEVECQGACVNAPMVMINRDTYEDLTPERLEEILDAFDAGKGDTIPPGPQVDRVFSAPPSGLTTLTDEKAIMRGPKVSNGKGGKTEKRSPPPSNAATPKTDSTETDEAIKSPSKKKTSAKAEKQASAEPSPTMKLAKTASSFREKKPAKGYGTGRKPNPTMALAGTASGAPRPSDAKQPAGIERPAKPDDLKLISGVGPKIEGRLHDLGIFTYKQVAGWKKAEREWVDDHLSFRGRIERDDWVKQAKALAKGGAAEYEKVFGKKPR